MIVVEGPDGGGKTRLVQALCDHYGIEPRPRAVKSSVGGPVDDLCDWVVSDLGWHHERLRSKIPGSYDWLTIYDRHPLVSEPIYGPVVRAKLPSKWTPEWYSAMLSHLSPLSPIVIFCMPPLDEVLLNVDESEEGQMEGVSLHIYQIYALYQAASGLWARAGWAAASVLYDYTEEPEFSLSNMLNVIDFQRANYQHLVGHLQEPERLN